VARGFTQEHGVHYHETFAPTIKGVHIWTLLAIDAHNDWEEIKSVLRYLKGTADSVLMYGDEPSSKLVGWSDSDYASDVGGRRFRTGYVFMLSGAAGSWKSQRHQAVAFSTTEA
jgi:hypothetical protein